MLTLIRGQLIHCITDKTTESIQDAALVFSDKGQIIQVGEFSLLNTTYKDAKKIELPPTHLIVPGFVDAHLHLPQLNMIGRYGESLLGWLEKYTFPEEAQFQSTAYAQKAAQDLIKEMISWGSVLGAFFASSSQISTEALFQACEDASFNAIIGKVSMGRHAPTNILVQEKQDLIETESLIAQWHLKKPNLRYAITPRFAPSCSMTHMKKLARLKAKHTGIYTQTHLAENKAEVEWIKKLFPNSNSYTEVYEKAGLLDDRTILAHCIYLNAKELRIIKNHKAIMCHCPSSNLFLGSGLMPLARYQSQNQRLALGSDIAGGTTLNMWANMGEAYKISQLRNETIHPEYLFYLATLGGATALGFESSLGNFTKGKDATFQVINPTGLLHETMTRDDISLANKLLALMCQVERTMITQVWISGVECLKKIEEK